MNLQSDPDEPGPLFLDDGRKQLLHRVACGLVAASATANPRSIGEFELGPLTREPVVGVFVTLMKDGQLRGCIGNFSASMPLAAALERAATGVATRDSRFSALLPSELPLLTLEVSLLHSRELLPVGPESRVSEVQVGQHGLDIQYRGVTGLLLPRVAVDHQWDATTFLEQVSRKAGLPSETWKDPEAVIYRFAAVHFAGPFPADLA